MGPTTKCLSRYHRAAKTAAALLPELPRPGESIHALMTGHYDLMQVILPTVGKLARCSHLRIATLCFNKRNTVEILSLLEERRDDPIQFTILVSDFFSKHQKELYEGFKEKLQPIAGTNIGYARSHCKVVTFDLGPGDGLVFEGSANLRTNGNREQLTVFRDRALHDWHAGWIDEMVNRGKEKATNSIA